MGTDDFFRKKKAAQSARKHAEKEPKANSYLIVTEGTKTEPNYFQGLSDYIINKFGGVIDIQTPEMCIDGQGKCTVSLVEETAKIVNRAHVVYEHVWVVFDKDDFDDFNEAILLAKQKGFESAWSNQSFEYWLYLHFHYNDSALHRSVWAEKLDKLFKDAGIRDEGYEKNLEDIFSLVTTSEYGNLKTAISNAKRVETSYSSANSPSLCDPCTKVHNLILELKPFIEELLL